MSGSAAILNGFVFVALHCFGEACPGLEEHVWTERIFPTEEVCQEAAVAAIKGFRRYYTHRLGHPPDVLQGQCWTIEKWNTKHPEFRFPEPSSEHPRP